jgi:hypothetical protein
MNCKGCGRQRSWPRRAILVSTCKNWGKSRKIPVGIDCVPTEIRTEYHTDTSLRRYRYANPTRLVTHTHTSNLIWRLGNLFVLENAIYKWGSRTHVHELKFGFCVSLKFQALSAFLSVCHVYYALWTLGVSLQIFIRSIYIRWVLVYVMLFMHCVQKVRAGTVI